MQKENTNGLHPVKQQHDDAKRCKATTKPLRPDDGKSHDMHGCYSISIFPAETYKTGRCALSQSTSTKIIILCGLDKHYLCQHKLIIHDNSLSCMARTNTSTTELCSFLGGSTN